MLLPDVTRKTGNARRVVIDGWRDGLGSRHRGPVHPHDAWVGRLEGLSAEGAYRLETRWALLNDRVAASAA